MLRFFCLCTLILFLLFPAFSQEQTWSGKNASFAQNGYSVVIAAVEDEAFKEQLREKYENGKRYYSPRPVITAYDSIVTVLQDKVKVDWQESHWDKEATFIKAITCRNGLKLMANFWMRIEKYYPEEDLILLNEIAQKRLIRLSNGEDAYLTERTDKLNGGLTIVGAQYNGEYHSDGSLQLLVQSRSKSGGRQTVVDLTQLLNEPSRLDFYFVVEGKLYILSYDEFWSVNIEKIKP